MLKEWRIFFFFPFLFHISNSKKLLLMKPIQLFVLTLLLFTSGVYSQFNKGSLLLGADLSFSTQSYSSGTTENDTHGFNFSPIIAVATKQNTFWGVSLNAAYSKSDASFPSNEQTFHSYGGSVFCRKYKAITARLLAFVQCGIAAGFGKFESNNGPDLHADSKSFTAGLNIAPGLSVSVSKKVFLEAGFNNIAAINYGHTKTTNYNFGTTTNNKISGFSFSSSLGVFNNSLYFGFRFFIPKNS